MSDQAWDQYRPDFAQHVLGRYAPRTFDAHGLPNSQEWTALCEKCNETKRGWCDSGQVRKHIQRVAMAHLHADELAAPRVQAPGSLRTGEPDK